MAAAVSFADLRTMMQKVDALAGKLDGAAPPAASPAPMVGQLVAGAMAVVEQRIAQFEQQFAQHEQRMANLAIEIRASIPQVPDFGPIAAALQAVVERLAAHPTQAADPPGLAALSVGTAETLKAVRELCARMDKPIVREGVADLPSGQVKLRITETRAK